AAACPLVAVVDVLGVQHAPGLVVALVEVRTMEDDTVRVLGDDRAEAERLEDLESHVLQEPFARYAFDYGTHQVPAVARVGVVGARLEEECVILEDGEALRDGRKALTTQELVAAIMTDAGDVPGDLACRDRPALLGK